MKNKLPPTDRLISPLILRVDYTDGTAIHVPYLDRQSAQTFLQMEGDHVSGYEVVVSFGKHLTALQKTLDKQGKVG